MTDRAELAAPNWRRQRMGETNPAYLAAIAQGHVMEPDRLPNLNGERWTCVACWRSAVFYKGNVYGLAVEGSCPEQAA